MFETTRIKIEKVNSNNNSSSDSIKNPEEQNKTVLPYVIPSTNLLSGGGSSQTNMDENQWKYKLDEVLIKHKIKATIVSVTQSTRCITYAVQPGPGVRVKDITKLEDTFTSSLGGKVEFEIPLKGTTYIGIHLFLSYCMSTSLKDLVESEEFGNSDDKELPLPMGIAMNGKPVVEDLDSLGHVLVGGSTGSGKSNYIDSLLIGLLLKNTPDELKTILIDTQSVDFDIYSRIPFNLFPVVNDSRYLNASLAWAVDELKKRNCIMQFCGVRDIDDYNHSNPSEGPRFLPHIVVIIKEINEILDDEETYNNLMFLLSMGKAAGIHLILSTSFAYTQKKFASVADRVGARVCFDVFDAKESKAILGVPGAERLANSGTYLFQKQGTSSISKIRAAEVSLEDINRVITFIDNQVPRNEFTVPSLSNLITEPNLDIVNERDEYFEEAGRFVIYKQKGSIGMLQRIFKINFNRATRIMDQLEEAGVVGPEEGIKPRKILMTIEELEEYLKQNK